jgi:Adenylate and Guanylate cyclase catalytic domain
MSPTRGLSTPISLAPTRTAVESQDVVRTEIPAYIQRDGKSMDSSSAFAVAWQHFPVYSGFSPLSIDRASSLDNGMVIAIMNGKAESSTHVHTWVNTTESSLFTDFLHKAFRSESLTKYETGDPLLEILYPVREELDQPTKPAGLISATITLAGLLAERNSGEYDSSMGLVIEITDFHGHTFVYGVNGDSIRRLPTQITTSNKGDLYEEAVLLLDSYTTGRTGRRRLQDAELSVVVYPQDSVRGNWKAVVAIIVMTLIVLVSFLILTVFRLFVFLASAQHDRALEKINKADALMSSLFPAKIKKRMMHEIQCPGGPRRGSFFGTEISIGSGFSRHTGLSKRSVGPAARRGSTGMASIASRRLSMDSIFSRRGSLGGASRKPSPGARRLSTGGRRTSLSTSAEGAIVPKASLDSVIADFHPECTIAFMDIRGFTAWCSEREPGQVFTLLESLYNRFDVIAAKRGVYKIETIVR